MTRFAQVFLIAITLFAVALIPQATEAATLRVEVREPDGSASASTPDAEISVEVTNVETGKLEVINTDKRGNARFRKLPGGKYQIVVKNWDPKIKRWRYRWFYRDLKSRGFITLKVPLGDGLAQFGYPELTGKFALAAIGKGNRSKATKSLAELKVGLKHHGQALLDLNRMFAAAHDKLMANLPANLRTRLAGQLARTKLDGRLAVVEKHRAEAAAAAKEILTQLRKTKKYYVELRKTLLRLTALEAKLSRLTGLYAAESKHRQYIEKARLAIEKINRALNAPKPAGKPTKTSQAPTGGYGDSEGASCFTAGTKVLMADGRTKPIEDVRIGERVRGKDGAVNTVTGIERPRLGKRLLYAINGGRAFVTAEHPFWTAGGWKSIDPRATFAENPRLTVGALAVGDLVTSLPRAERSLAAVGMGAVAVSYAPSTSLQTIAIRSILGVTGDPDTRVYNLLLDGNHSYFADGFLVHNKG